MAQSVLDLILRTKKQGTAPKEAKEELDDLNTSAKSGEDSFTEFNSALSIASKGLEFAKAAFAETGAKFVEYAANVRRVAQSTGLAAEESSRLIQVADDVGVSVETLTSTLELATKKGFQPSIENLADLADRLQGISDPTERAAILSDLFGRNWAAIVPILKDGGAALRENAEAVSGMLILDDAAIKKAREFEIAADNLGDAWDGFSMVIGQAVVPELAELLNQLTTVLTAAEKLETMMAGASDQVLETAKSYDEYTGRLRAAAEAAGFSVDENGRLIETYYVHGRAIEAVINEHYMLSGAQYETQQSANALNAEIQAGIDAQAVAAEQMAVFGLSLDELEAQYQETKNATDQQALAQSLANQEAQDAQNAFNLQAEAAKNLAGATETLKDAQANWSQSVGTDLASQLEQAIGDTGKFEEALRVIDEVMGTNTETTDKQQDAMEKLVAEYKKDGELEKFREGVNKLKDDFLPLNDQVKKAQENVDTLTKRLDALNGKRVKAYVDIVITETAGGGGEAPPKPPPGRGAPPKRQHGGGVEPEWLYQVGEGGAEYLMTNTPGWVFTQAQAERALAMTFQNSTFNFSPQAGQTGRQAFEEFERFMAEKGRMAARNGTGIAGR